MVRSIRAGVGNGIGWGIGLGVALGLTGAASGGLRPLAKGAMRAALALQEKATLLTAEAGEMAEDLWHEVREEREVERAAREEVEAHDRRSADVLLIPADGGDR